MEIRANLSADEVQLFSERVRRGLSGQPLGLAPETHRHAVAELLGKVGDTTFYELLGLGPGASDAEVHDAYNRLARLVHPSHAAVLGLAGKEGVLELLFERATLGYLTLSHPDRRKRYDAELGTKLWQPALSGPARGEEAHQVARRYFARANVLAASEEYHLAIELLRQAARLDPQAEYYALLGQLEAKNPKWLRLAEADLARAVELGGRQPGLHDALTRVREEKAALEAEAAGAAGHPVPEDGDSTVMRLRGFFRKG
jgi:tetratricopeptide (TPR) repeat protein